MSKPDWNQKGWDIALKAHSPSTWPADAQALIAQALAAAYRAGQEEMRERASRLCQDYADTAEAPQPIRWASSANSVAIRALPIGGQDE